MAGDAPPAAADANAATDAKAAADAKALRAAMADLVAAHAALTGPYGLTSLLRTATSKRSSQGFVWCRSSGERIASPSASMVT